MMLRWICELPAAIVSDSDWSAVCSSIRLGRPADVLARERGAAEQAHPELGDPLVELGVVELERRALQTRARPCGWTSRPRA